MPKVSIIIPVFKAEKDIKRCLDSIISQSYDNWECILVNDGSPDNSGAICEEYAQNDNRFKVYYKKNGGPSSARNYGLDHSTGSFICFIDSDDFVGEFFLKHLVEPMEQDVDVKMTVAGLIKFGKEEAKFPPKAFHQTVSSKEVFDNLLRGDIVKGWLCNKCFRSSLLGTYRLNEKLRFCEDLELQLRLTHFEPEFKVVFVDSYDYFYRIQDGGASLSHNVRNKVSMIDMFNDCLECYPDTTSKRIRLLKGCFNQCRSLATIELLHDGDKQIIKKARRTFLLYRKEARAFFNMRQKIQIILILISFRIYKLFIN